MDFSPEIILNGLDMPVMVAIAVIAFFLEKSEKVSDEFAMVVPFVLGAAWGLLSSMSDGIAGIYKGILINGAAASFLARFFATVLKSRLNGVSSAIIALLSIPALSGCFTHNVSKDDINTVAVIANASVGVICKNVPDNVKPDLRLAMDAILDVDAGNTPEQLTDLIGAFSQIAPALYNSMWWAISEYAAKSDSEKEWVAMARKVTVNMAQACLNGLG